MLETAAPALTQLRLNDRTVPCPQSLTLAALLAAHGLDAAHVATAVNGEYVARAQRPQYLLQPGDTVLTFQAIVGG